MKLNLYENEKNHLLCLSDEKEISSVKSINGLKDYLKCRKSVARKKGKKALKLLYGEKTEDRSEKRLVSAVGLFCLSSVFDQLKLCFRHFPLQVLLINDSLN